MKYKQLNKWDTVGVGMILVGGSVWFLYAAMRWGFGLDVDSGIFLLHHLGFIIPGMLIKRRKFLLNTIKKLK